MRNKPNMPRDPRPGRGSHMADCMKQSQFALSGWRWDGGRCTNDRGPNMRNKANSGRKTRAGRPRHERLAALRARAILRNKANWACRTGASGDAGPNARNKANCRGRPSPPGAGVVCETKPITEAGSRDRGLCETKPNLGGMGHLEKTSAAGRRKGRRETKPIG